MKNNLNNLLTDSDVRLPKGFSYGSYEGGIKNGHRDTSLILADVPCTCAGVYTRNAVKAHCVVRNRNLTADSDSRVRALTANSGNANACTGKEGQESNLRFASAVAKALGCRPEEVLTASTGVIGVQLPIESIEENAVNAGTTLGRSPDHFLSAAEAIMTTDTKRKCASFSYEFDGEIITISGMAKGSGMIHPNMGTMLAFITTDAILPSSVLQSTLRLVADETFNMVSVDGDTSTNDMLLILAPGTDAGTMKANGDNHDYAGFFRTALQEVCRYLAVEIARDGEGASKLLRCRVEGAASLSSARLLAKEVIGSSLVKCAFFGEDANWGRIIAAMGYSGVEFTEESVSISFRSFDQSKTVSLMKDGTPIVFSEEKASEILSEKEIEIFISMNDGSASATAWGCDLTYDYVKINGDYRT
jgi:glutamate N-acetyltransferase/amino-acid N-acetyltransferase